MDDIFVNSVIEWRDEEMKITTVERVLWIAFDRSQIVVIGICDDSQLPEYRYYMEVEEALRHGIARKLRTDPYAKFMKPNGDFSENSLKNRDKAWNIICDLVELEPEIYDERQRGKLVEQVCMKQSIHKRVVYRHLKHYWVRGKAKNALLPNFVNCGAPGVEKKPKSDVKLGRPRNVTREDPTLGGVNVNFIDKKNINIAIKQWYLNTDENPMTFAYRQMLENHYNTSVYFKNGVPIPILTSNDDVISYVQFQYWANKVLSDLKHTMLKRFGERKYNLLKRPLLGNATTRSFGPGSVFEIDATPVNVYFVSEFDRRRIIGRAVLYIIKDVFSRLIAGIYVGLEGPSWLGAMMALENATSNKVEFCAQYGITIDESDWPCHYLPKSITADGGEMKSHNADNLTDTLGVRTDIAPPYRADLKGIVEQNFRMEDRRIAPFVPGLIRKEIRERGEPDYRLNARLTIKAFTKIIILTVLEHNKKELHDYPLDRDMTADGIPPIPLELWNWGIAHIAGLLHEKPQDIIRLNLMPRAKASVTRQGIYFEKMYFGCDVALAESWYERASVSRFEVPIAFDPRNTNYIYIPNKDGTECIKCQRLKHLSRFDDMRLEEVQDQLYIEEVESHRRKTSQNQNTAEATAQIKAIVKEEKELTEEVWPTDASKASIVNNIKENRKQDREAIRQQQSWEIGKDTSENGNAASVIPFSRAKDEKVDDPLMTLLQQQREERRKK